MEIALESIAHLECEFAAWQRGLFQLQLLLRSILGPRQFLFVQGIHDIKAELSCVWYQPQCGEAARRANRVTKLHIRPK
jgi:hypothetical protein